MPLNKKKGAEKQPFHLSYAAKNYFDRNNNKRIGESV